MLMSVVKLRNRGFGEHTLISVQYPLFGVPGLLKQVECLALPLFVLCLLIWSGFFIARHSLALDLILPVEDTECIRRDHLVRISPMKQDRSFYQ